MYVGDVNNPLSIIDKTRQKISKDIEDLNNTVKRLDLNNIYRMLYQTTAEHTLFSSACSTFTRPYTCLAPKKRDKTRKTKIIHIMFFQPTEDLY